MNFNAPTLTELHTRLTDKNWTLSCAESCTAGGLGYACTEIAGSSAWFLGGIIAYCNAVKNAVLNVPETTLQEHGAVSEPVVLAMAKGAQKLLATDWALATSGIAGPDGGSPQKPVGTVCFAWVYRDQFAQTQTVCFDGSREGIRTKSVHFSLHHLHAFLQNF